MASWFLAGGLQVPVAQVALRSRQGPALDLAAYFTSHGVSS